jgi:ABC-2 type transport system ATP-binding protein
VSFERSSSESPESTEALDAPAADAAESAAKKAAPRSRKTASKVTGTGEHQTGEEMAGNASEEEPAPPKAPARTTKRRPASGTAKTAAAAVGSSTTTRGSRSSTSKTTSPKSPTPSSTTARATKAPTRAPKTAADSVATPATVEQVEQVEQAEPVETAEKVHAVDVIPEVVTAPTPEPIPQPGTTAAPAAARAPSVLSLSGLHKRFGDTVAVNGVSLEVAEGSLYGIVGPNGAGKTTTLSMVTGLLRPDAGRVLVHGVDAWKDPVKAKRAVGVLPDKLRMFDRLTGAQLLHYAGSLRGLNAKTVRSRSADLARAFGIEDALNRLVADYSAGMSKKIALAAAMIHSPRLLVLDEPFESVDPVSAANVIDILQRYVAAGGTVVLSSHGMDLIQRVCDSVAIIVRGEVLAAGTIDEVRGEQTLEERFVELAGGRKAAEGMEWLHSFSD